MSRIVSSRAAVFAAGVVLTLALIGGVVTAGVVGLEFGATSGEAAVKPLKTAYAHVNGNGTIARSRGSVRVQKVASAANKNQYCFDLDFVPKVAVASAFWINSAWVSTATKDDNFSTGCTAPLRRRGAGLLRRYGRHWRRRLQDHLPALTPGRGDAHLLRLVPFTQLAPPPPDAAAQHCDQDKVHGDSDGRTRRTIESVRRVRLCATQCARSVFGTDSVGPADYWLAIVVVVVVVGHLTQRRHIFHESHVPSQQT
jgi:hypothetical protein